MTRQFLISLAAFIGLVLIGFVATTRAQPRYTLTHLRGVGAATIAYGINDAGVAVGASGEFPSQVSGISFNNSSQALMWGADGNPINLGRLPGQPATQGAGATDINNNGEVVGWALQPFMTTTFMHAVRFSGGTASLLRSDLGAPSIAYRINDSGQIIGRTNAAGPFLVNGGSVTFLQSPGAAAEVTDISNHGRMVGFETIPGNPTRPVEFRPGQSALVLSTGSVSSGTAWGINDHGRIVGQIRVSVSTFDAHYPAVEFLGAGPSTLAPLGSFNRSANAINELGQIVGTSSAGLNFPPRRAAIFENGLALDLNLLIAADPRWTLTEATDINNLGQIIGYGRFDHDNSPSTPTQTAAWRLDPIPEPVAFAGVAAAVLLLRRRK